MSASVRPTDDDSQAGLLVCRMCDTIMTRTLFGSWNILTTCIARIAKTCLSNSKTHLYSLSLAWVVPIPSEAGALAG